MWRYELSDGSVGYTTVSPLEEEGVELGDQAWGRAAVVAAALGLAVVAVEEA